MMVPSIHLNGTSRTELLNEQLNILQALRLARAAMIAASPNGRDYYPQGAGAHTKAQDEHTERVRAIEGVLAKVEALAMAISDGGHRPS